MMEEEAQRNENENELARGDYAARKKVTGQTKPVKHVKC